MKKLITVIAVLLLLVGCTVVQNAADNIQRNFKLQQLEYGLSLGADHKGGWQNWGANDIGVSEDEFLSYEYRNAGTLEEPDVPHEPVDPRPRTIGEIIKEHEGVRGIQFSTDEHGNVQAAYIRGKHGGMKLVSMGDGLENVSSKI